MSKITAKIRQSAWAVLLAFAVLLGFLSASGIASGQEIEGLHRDATRAIEAQIRASGLRSPQVSIFYGDLTGERTNDAISFVYHDVGGSGPQLVTWVWRESGGDYTLSRTVSSDEVFGYDPRNATFALDRISVTTTVPQSNDAHCCPTGERTFTLDVSSGDAVDTLPAELQKITQFLDVPFAETDRVGSQEWCSSQSIVSGLDPNGDGFLAVRAGPGTEYRKIDQLHNGDAVYICGARGDWLAIVYGPSKSNAGWAHSRWLAG
ncbi:SH3 domain-containing protein [Pararhizobium haloflavum]|uniref:SH3 domain-containing protein n=1 Tax=Pararhizobium haloflavum TaxID=2037914 RepID=UPI000C18BF4B|nr:SH3 domain-containing protein [Pararhizobium haloflavum]